MKEELELISDIYKRINISELAPREAIKENLRDARRMLNDLTIKLSQHDGIKNEGLIKVEISRVLCDDGWKPFMLTCRTHKIKRAYDKYGTLKELKTYYNIEKLHKTKKKEWAISSRGTKHEWFVYEAYVSLEYVI